tara:strand:- start:490 stop:1185 length:696 start_codon:yes stop_codon:yes gene_type:complete
MQKLVSAVVDCANVFPEEACCALVDSKYRKHMARWVKMGTNSSSNLLSEHEIQNIAKDVTDRLNEPTYFNEIRTVCDILNIKKYAKGMPGRHLHPWCSTKKDAYDITVDQVVAAGNITQPDFIQWSSDGNENNKIEEAELLSELQQEGLSNRMKGFIMQEVMSHRLSSGQRIVPPSMHHGNGTKPKKSLSQIINESMVRSEAEHVKQWQRYKVSERRIVDCGLCDCSLSDC